MSKKSKFWSTFLVVAVMLTLVITMSFSGCKKAEEKAEPAEEAAEEAAAPAEEKAAEKPFEGVIINVVGLLEWPNSVGLWEQLPQFEEKTGIKVNVNDFPFEELKATQVREGEAKSGALDVMHMFDFGMLATARYALPLNDFIERDIGIDKWKANMNAAGVEYGTVDGNICFIASFGGVACGAYRKDLFEDPEEKEAFMSEYGYELKPPTTIQERVDIAKFFTRDNDGDGENDLWGLVAPGAGEHGLAGVFENYLYTTGVKGYLTPDKKFLWGKDFPENASKVLEVMKMNQDLIWTHKVSPEGVASMQVMECSELYFAGKAAMIESWINDIWKDMISDEVVAKIGESGSYVYPSYNPPNGQWIGFWGWGVSKDSKNPEAAWEFIKWATSLETGKGMLQNPKTGIFLPAQVDVMEWGVQEGYLIPAQVEASKNAVALLTIPEVDLIRSSAREYNELLTSNQITPQQFIDKLTIDAEEILAGE